MTVNVADITSNLRASWLFEVSNLMVELEIYWPYPYKYTKKAFQTDQPRKSTISARYQVSPWEEEIKTIGIILYTLPREKAAKKLWWTDFPKVNEFNVQGVAVNSIGSSISSYGGSSSAKLSMMSTRANISFYKPVKSQEPISQALSKVQFLPDTMSATVSMQNSNVLLSGASFRGEKIESAKNNVVHNDSGRGIQTDKRLSLTNTNGLCVFNDAARRNSMMRRPSLSPEKAEMDLTIKEEEPKNLLIRRTTFGRIVDDGLDSLIPQNPTGTEMPSPMLPIELKSRKTYTRIADQDKSGAYSPQWNNTPSVSILKRNNAPSMNNISDFEDSPQPREQEDAIKNLEKMVKAELRRSREVLFRVENLLENHIQIQSGRGSLEEIEKLTASVENLNMRLKDIGRD
jgi:hypothetical protein